MKFVLLTFGGGNKKYHDAVLRISNQAKEFNLFDEILAYDETHLENVYPEFWEKHKNFILSKRRGFGYWIWKSYLCLKTLESLDENDLLFYIDCGCELNILGKKRFLEYIDLVIKYKRMSFHLEPVHNDKIWNKMDLIEYLNMNNKSILEEPQNLGGIQFYLKNDENINLLKQYYQLSSNYHFIDDSPSLLKNFPCFKEHRHDQSIISLLYKKYNYFRILDETWFPNLIGDKKQYPILALRNYSLESKLKDLYN
jgi:hypothetical protein